MKTFSILSVAALLLLGSGLDTASAQNFGGIRVGNRDFSLGIHVGKDRHRGPRRHARPIHRHSRHCHLVTTPGHWELVRDRVWRQGVTEQVWIEPLYEDRCDRFGRNVRVLVRNGYYRNEVRPGYWEECDRRVWVAGTSYYACGY
ncbi:MAG: hypothetical protein KDB53_02565 [Planctomycetes bacterium]|nr:hypothetical protein [Planctomycetota bacterium]